jgi:hypothetical protein
VEDRRGTEWKRKLRNSLEKTESNEEILRGLMIGESAGERRREWVEEEAERKIEEGRRQRERVETISFRGGKANLKVDLFQLNSPASWVCTLSI